MRKNTGKEIVEDVLHRNVVYRRPVKLFFFSQINVINCCKMQHFRICSLSLLHAQLIAISAIDSHSLILTGLHANEGRAKK